jgi:hypothetical protein
VLRNSLRFSGLAEHFWSSAERGRVDRAKICKVLHALTLRLNAGNDNDLARLVDVLKLHGFLPYFDAG